MQQAVHIPLRCADYIPLQQAVHIPLRQAVYIPLRRAVGTPRPSIGILLRPVARITLQRSFCAVLFPPTLGGGEARPLLPLFGVDHVALVVLPIVQGVGSIGQAVQKAAIEQGGHEFARLVLPSGVKGDIEFIHARQPS